MSVFALVAVLALSMVVRPPDCVGRVRFRSESFCGPPYCRAGDIRAFTSDVGPVSGVSTSSSLPHGVGSLFLGFLLCNFVISFCMLRLSMVPILHEVFARRWFIKLHFGLRPFVLSQVLQDPCSF